MTIKCYPSHKLDDIDMISLAVCGDSKQRHVGILYNSPKHNTVKLLHLEWYNRLQLDEPTYDYIWITANLPETVKITLTAWCELIYEQNKTGIAYDIGLNAKSFDEMGRFIKKDEFSGLTCASFAMQVFKSHSIDLVDLTNWPIRETDKKWQSNILNYLVRYIPASRQSPFLDKKIKEIELGLQRFKPEEIASAAGISGFPHAQNALRIPARKIVKIISILRKSCH